MSIQHVNHLIFNKLSESQYQGITPVDGQIYCTPDTLDTQLTNLTTTIDNIETINTNNMNNINIIKKLYGLETKVWNNKTWLKMMYHNAENGTLFFNSTNVKLNFHPHLYSICQFMPCFDNNGFEFLLEYPELNKHNNWFQTSCPTLYSDSVVGYRAIDVQMTLEKWGGLSLSTSADTWMDGSPGDGNWWYATGCYSVFNGGIPGGNSSVVQEYYLWVRVD